MALVVPPRPACPGWRDPFRPGARRAPRRGGEACSPRRSSGSADGRTGDGLSSFNSEITTRLHAGGRAESGRRDQDAFSLVSFPTLTLSPRPSHARPICVVRAHDARRRRGAEILSAHHRLGDTTVRKDYMMWTSGGVPIAGIFRLGPEQRQKGIPPNWMPYVDVNNVDETARKTALLGGKVTHGPAEIPGTGRFAVLQD